MADLSVREVAREVLDRDPRSVLKDVFGVHGVNPTGARRRSLREQLIRISSSPFVRVACITVRPPGGTATAYANLQRDLDNANDTLAQCGAWVFCAGSQVVQSAVLGTNGLLDQSDCNAGWFLDFIGIGDHEVSREEDRLFDLGRSFGAHVVGYFIPSAVSGLAGCAAHPGGRRGFWVGMTTSSQWTFAHELAHVVGNLGHSDRSSNLMFTPTASITRNPPRIRFGQCASPLANNGILRDPAMEFGPDASRPPPPFGRAAPAAPPAAPPAASVPEVVEAALAAECGNPLAESGAVEAEARRMIERVVLDGAETSARRARAAYLLALWPDDGSVGVLREALASLDERGRQSVAATLGVVGSPAAVVVLARLSRDDDVDVRRLAVNRLGRVGSAEADAVLGRVAREDPDPGIRARADEGLQPDQQ